MGTAMEIRLLYVPCSGEDEAVKLARAAMKNKLAACANLLPIRSIYPWKGEVQDEQETVLLIKTLPYKLNDLKDFIAREHSYEVPCILELTAEANLSFQQWMTDLLI